MSWDESWDFIVVGSGAASVCAALVAQQAGKRALIVEKTDLFGGSTAISGGVIWIPNNPVILRAGVADDAQKAEAYLARCVGDSGPGASPERQRAFLREGPKAVAFLERNGMRFLHCEGYSDYHEGEYPGALARGRSIVADNFDLRRLGSFASRMRRGFPLPVFMDETVPLCLFGRSWRSRLTLARLAWRMLQNKLGRQISGMGVALQGRLAEIALKQRLPMHFSSKVVELIEENSRVVGVAIERDGKRMRLEAKSGVLLDAGGFSRNVEMRQRYLLKPTSVEFTHVSEAETGDLHELAFSIGAGKAMMEQAWWSSSSKPPDGPLMVHPYDIAKPHSIVVDASGQRYLNEATSYVTVGIAMYERNKTIPAVPSWCISDHRHRSRYTWGGRLPGKTPESWIQTGYMKRADSLADLARQCSIPFETLQSTIERFNRMAERGLDDDFGRGGSAYARFQGDPTVKPNPSLGAISEPPFYACQIRPGDVGTSGGILTDERARVLTDAGLPIQGLYATGNCTASVLGRSYPGAGASIGAALTFGYVAATDAVRAHH